MKAAQITIFVDTKLHSSRNSLLSTSICGAN